MTPLYHESIPDAPGIYRIRCTITDKFYIGSAVNLRRRKQDHFKTLRSNTHHNKKMQNAFNKYGENAFVFEVLELVLFPELLTTREQFYFNKLKPFGKRGFNLNPTAGSSLGREVSAETRERIGAPQRGRISQFKGKKHTPEALKKMSTSHRGKPACNKGVAMSPEQKEKIRVARTSSMKTLIFISPTGEEFLVTGLRQFCKDHNLFKHHIMRVARGECEQHKGWRARFPDPPTEEAI